MKVEWQSDLQVFSPEECQALVKEFLALEHYDENKESTYYKNSLGFYNMPGSLAYVDRVTSFVKDRYPQLTFNSTYARMYQRNSTLNIHTDRKGLDVAISICIEDNNNLDWPLNISAKRYDGGDWDLEKDPSHFKTKYLETHCSVGYGAVMEGRNFPHWREELLCGEKQRAIYLFYFWSIPETESKITRLVKEIEEKLAELKEEMAKGQQ